MGNLTDLFPAPASNNVLEVVDGVADGRTVVTNLDSYTYGSVSSVSNMSTSIVTIPGTSIDYTPPSNAKWLSYKATAKFSSEGYSGISHIYLYVDSTEIIPAYSDIASQYSSSNHNHGDFIATVQYVFDLMAYSDDIANGKFSSWTTDKTIEMRAREYSTSYQSAFNKNTYEDGAGASGTESYDRPIVQIIAYE